MVISLLFWVSAACLFYTFFGYLLLIRLLAGLFPRPAKRAVDSSGTLKVCAVVIACNEERRIAARVENLLASDYPGLSVLIVSDGSTDATVEIVRNLKNPLVNCLERRERTGKAACLNAAVSQTDAPVIVFADARQRFAPDTVSKLVSNFLNPAIGAASGVLEIDPSASSVGGGVDAYWKLEKIIRRHESIYDSCIGCTGAVYAIRRDLFRPIPEDTILDDVVIPMMIAVQNYRVFYDVAAVAYDPQSLEPAAEKVRKQKTIAGNFQMFFRYFRWLLPWRNRLWWQLISHKYLRIAAPVFLFLILISGFLLIRSPFYLAVFALQILFYFVALAGLAFPSLKIRCVSLPAGFVFLNAMTVRGFFHYLRMPTGHGWESPRESR
jgi:cellulose synthase/poly-beta-1,6-N-acetylglucosamine synthase-like glycosyltransferase